MQIILNTFLILSTNADKNTQIRCGAALCEGVNISSLLCPVIILECHEQPWFGSFLHICLETVHKLLEIPLALQLWRTKKWLSIWSNSSLLVKIKELKPFSFGGREVH